MLRTIATSVALLVGLAVVGSVAGPQWDPQPLTAHVVPTTTDTTIRGAEADDADRVGDHDVATTRVDIELDGASVGGLLRRPVDDDGAPLTDVPGVVFVHGAGTGRAEDAFVDTATDLAGAGIATLVPDKRLDTYSLRERDYEQMADDYLRSVDLLRATPGVDPRRVGVYAESEGTWIAPVMQVDDPRVAFTVLVSAPVVPPREQAAFAVDNYLRNTDVPDQVFRAIPRAVGMQFPGGGFGYADFDVRPWLERQSAPVLVVYGTADPSMPVEQGARLIIADVGLSPARAPVTVRYYGGANHGIRVPPQGSEGSDPAAVPPLHPDLSRDLAAWVHGLPGSATAEPVVAGATPEQLYLAAPVPQPRWWGNGDVVVAAVVAGGGLVLVGLLTGAVGAFVRRLRRRGARGSARTARAPAGPLPDGPSPAGPERATGLALALLGIGSVVTVVVLAAYLVAVARLAMDYERDALIVQGGWIAVRLLGVAAVVGAALLVGRLRQVRQGRKEGHDVALARGGVAHVTLWCVVVGSTSLLLTLAYWGVYQLGI
ncbi:alpha/beta hydrolase family protein [Isoptericola jiangsuensis]|uniref:alpha/beta hydrolase family protein n=1 Tax=Isoptericola jiangsuensis TaxID=548579 RepID=UPI003AAB8B94